ncbi:MAG: hypothetical protein GW809_05505 [Bacteroidetes bacterium]|nr:hypothetical protein [Bacteroidota bacterium]
MNVHKQLTITLLFALFFINPELGKTQILTRTEKDLSYQMKISGIEALSSSYLHVYALSSTEGLAVFRSFKDSLQWLFTLSDVQERGDILKSDLRFAYLYGDSSRIHIIEPTNLLGIYSVADVGFEVKDLARVNEYLYVVGYNGDLGTVHLIHPDSVVLRNDSRNFSFLQKQSIKSIESSNQTLALLTTNDSLFIAEQPFKEWILNYSVKTPEKSDELFYEGNQFFLSTQYGELFKFSFKDSTFSLFSRFSDPIDKLQIWNSSLVVKTDDGSVFIADSSGNNLISSSFDAGNIFTVSKNNLWITEYSDMYRLKKRKLTSKVYQKNFTSDWKLAPIEDQIIPYPKPVLVHFSVNPSSMETELLFTVKSSFEQITQYENNMLWQPTARDIGKHLFTVMASDKFGKKDSLLFTVEIKAFNMPPKFIPIRPMSIPVNEKFELTFKAQDMDGMNKNLIRYVGLDMPQNAFINERTGEFDWTPDLQQVGKHVFRIIASDQYGTAASLDVEFSVLDIRR